jgi:hypothetical protein
MNLHETGSDGRGVNGIGLLPLSSFSGGLPVEKVSDGAALFFDLISSFVLTYPLKEKLFRNKFDLIVDGVYISICVLSVYFSGGGVCKDTTKVR